MTDDKYKAGEQENFTTIRVTRKLRDLLRQHRQETGEDTNTALEEAVWRDLLIRKEGHVVLSETEYEVFKKQLDWKKKYINLEFRRNYLASVLWNDVVLELASDLALASAHCKREGVEPVASDDEIRAEQDRIRKLVADVVAEHVPDECWNAHWDDDIPDGDWSFLSKIIRKTFPDNGGGEGK